MLGVKWTSRFQYHQINKWQTYTKQHYTSIYSTVTVHSLATELFEKSSVVSARTHGRSEEVQLSSGWTLIESELSTLKFKPSVRAEQSFAICYPNLVIKSLSDNLDICLDYWASTYLVAEFCSLAFGRRPQSKVEDFLNCTFRSRSWTS